MDKKEDSQDEDDNIKKAKRDFVNTRIIKYVDETESEEVGESLETKSDMNLTYIVSHEVDTDNVAVYIHADNRIQGAFDELDETESKADESDTQINKVVVETIYANESTEIEMEDPDEIVSVEQKC